MGVPRDLIFGWRFGRGISASVGQQLDGWLVGKMSINGVDRELGGGMLMFAQGPIGDVSGGGTWMEREQGHG